MIEDKEVNIATTPDAKQPKKPYTAPRIIMHGTVVQITANIGTSPDTAAIGSFTPVN